MLHVELGREFRLPAVLQPVRRLVQQSADQLAIAAVALAAEADAVVGGCVVVASWWLRGGFMLVFPRRVGFSWRLPPPR